MLRLKLQRKEQMKSLLKIVNSIPRDKLLHFIACYLLVNLLSLFLPNILACLLVLVVGISKEVYDKISGKGTCDWKDIVADLAGIAAAYLS